MSSGGMEMAGGCDVADCSLRCRPRIDREIGERNKVFERPISSPILWAGCLLFLVMPGVALIGAGAWLEGPVLILGGIGIGVWAERWSAREERRRLAAWDRLSEEVEDANGNRALGEWSVKCVGLLDIPDRDVGFFEPVVFTPADLAWNRGHNGLKFAVILAAMLVVLGTGVLPFPFLNALVRRTYYVYVMAGVPIVSYLFRLCFAADYIRLAPGMIQHIRYGWRIDGMKIRSFPLGRGTGVEVVGASPGSVIEKVRLGRGNELFEFSPARIRNPGRASDAVWDAILSTSPTPPLSTTSLSG